ncbi:MAG: DUF484 family protein [Xanthomonadales bacterium]|jgi:uncharacterized protein YigA (DUF484 family)|nr:DUF484 family protein [Xanthomonadales bacterium]
MTDSPPLDAEAVAQFLIDHPDFLTHFPKVLGELQLPHESGEAVSLIERQVEQLRSRNEKLTGQLNQLIRVAGDNEKLMIRLHSFTLELMTIGDLTAFFDRLAEVLQDEFEADVLNISLYDREIQGGDRTPIFKVDPDSPELEPLKAQLDRKESSCGRLNRNKLDTLFRSRAQWVQSTALVPIADKGFLAIGSSDPARFYPGMGTLFLDLLAQVIFTRLEIEAPEQQRRTA